jgi:hypothetical protein
MQLFNNALCLKCKGRNYCKKPCLIYSKIKNFSIKTKTHFSGNSPPEIFVGKFNYPYINAGILSPDNYENTESYSMPEIWHEKKMSIEDILSNRAKLIYAKFKTEIKKPKAKDKFISIMQEISMAYKPVSTEFFLKKPPSQSFEIHKHSPIIANPAPIKDLKLQENAKITTKVDMLVSDCDLKSTDSIKELYNSNIAISKISKILSAGLLGLKTQRKLVPTRWSITAVDDTLSKNLLKKIRYYPEINEILLFHSEYNGNHYEIILLPDKFSFEVIELEFPKEFLNNTGKISITHDNEGFFGRKEYANNVSGAYYANRFSLAEHLEKIKRQASALFLREITPEYYAPLGVGILREITRDAFKKISEKCLTIKQALEIAQKRLKSDINIFKNYSVLLKEHSQQKKLNLWF